MTIPILEKFPELVCGVSTRADGNMGPKYGASEEVRQHRDRWLASLGISPEALEAMCVLGGERIGVIVSPPARGGARRDGSAECCMHNGYELDALMTNVPGHFLFLLTGDCLPVILYDPTHRAVALAHLGWKGVDLELGPKTIARMRKEYGTNPRELVVAIGPGIHKESYIKENPDQRNDPRWKPYVERVLDDNRHVIASEAKQSCHYAIDIVGFAFQQLRDACVPEHQIDVAPYNTATDNRFFSHYRSNKTGELDGRFATVVGFPSFSRRG